MSNVVLRAIAEKQEGGACEQRGDKGGGRHSSSLTKRKSRLHSQIRGEKQSFKVVQDQGMNAGTGGGPLVLSGPAEGEGEGGRGREGTGKERAQKRAEVSR